MSSPRRVQVCRDAQALAETTARMFADRSKAASEASEDGMFRVALSGGNTPRGMYRALADRFRDEVKWDAVQVFFSDERFVSLESPESNFHLARQELLGKVPIPDRWIHPVPTEGLTPRESAASYEEGIRRVFHTAAGEVPRFDAIFLGLGQDGHTASLFPDTAALDDTSHLVTANFVPKLDMWRITFTYPLINAGRLVVFLVEGEGKADIVAQILGGGSNLPSARVNPAAGELLWLLDEGAASKLPADVRGEA